MTDEDTSFRLPEIADEDVARISRLLCLPAHAFTGADGNDSRLGAMRARETIDVAACPGSGKTTLLVAKLAILADKWQERTRGICVLSHTNVARREIETRIGNTSSGQKLLNYPHFIGTIHGFVNAYLAIPWLTARGITIKMVDTDVALNRRWNALDHKSRRGLEKAGHSRTCLRVKSAGGGVGEVRWGAGMLGHDKPMYKKLVETCGRSISDGYHCHEEMFVWAAELLATKPALVEVIRDRFPILFLDEAQDNSEEQSALLHRVFLQAPSSVVRQRFGDPNQAIFDYAGETAATTDPFPSVAGRVDLPTSHRFDQTIADLADPLGLRPYGLKGRGPRERFDSAEQSGAHTIFLFDDNRAGEVLPAYAQLLSATFSRRELAKGSFVAIGQVHVRKEESPTESPRSVPDYWPAYDPTWTRRDPKPGTMIQFLLLGLAGSASAGESHPIAMRATEGIVRLVEMAPGLTPLARRSDMLRRVAHLLDTSPTAKKLYRSGIAWMILRRRMPTEHEWNRRWIQAIRALAETVAGSAISGAEADTFLRWEPSSEASANPAETGSPRANTFSYPAEDPQVHIRLGSIHSVKGETHSAALVLETRFHEHNLESIKSWLLGEKCGENACTERVKKRLKLHYVAMTRPTHLLCLAMKKSSFAGDDGELAASTLQTLESRGWRVMVLK